MTGLQERLVLYLDKILLKSRGVVVIPVIVKSTDAAGLGTYSTIIATIGLLGAIGLVGFGESVPRYLHQNVDRKRLAAEYWSLIIITASVTVILAGFWNLAAASFDRLVLDGSSRDLIQVGTIFLIAWTVDSLNLHFFRGQGKSNMYAAFESGRTFLEICILAGVWVYGLDINAILIGFTVVRFSAFFLTTGIIVQRIGLAFPRFDLALKHIELGLPLVVGQIANWSFRLSDRYLIGIFGTTSAIGIYSAAYGLGFHAIQFFMAPINVTILPNTAALAEKNERGKIRREIQNSLDLFLFFAIPGLVGLTTLRSDLLLLFTNEVVMKSGAILVPLTGAAALSFGLFVLSATVYKLEEQTGAESRVWIVGSIINILLNLVLLPRFGIIAAAISTLVSALVMYAVTAYRLYSVLEVGPDVVRLVRNVASAIFTGFVTWFVPVSGVVSLTGAVISGAAAYFIVSAVLGGIPRELRNKLT